MKQLWALLLWMGVCIPGFSQIRSDTTFYSVKDFGAKGDGHTDDQQPILHCLKTAAAHPGIVVVRVPYGTYLIDQSLKVLVTGCDRLVIRGYSKAGKLPLLKTAAFITLLDISSPLSAPKGKVSVEGLALQGNNLPFSSTHPYFDKSGFTVGLRILNMAEASVLHNQISNFYGDGIYVGYSDAGAGKPSHRFDHVNIIDNEVINCWGLHSTKSPAGVFDNYGDGIYTSNLASGNISKNKIINHLNITKQVGRAGLVLEYNDEDCVVNGNYIFGYDRDIHLEADVGGHLIENNTLEGTDFGILIFNNPAYRSKPIKIIGNIISNKGFPAGNHFTLIRNSQERCLLSFYAKGTCRQGSEIMDNHFVIYPGNAYKFSYIARFIADGLRIKGNTFSSELPSGVRKTVFLNAVIDTLVNNTFDNVDLQVATHYQGRLVGGNKVDGKVNSAIKIQ